MYASEIKGTMFIYFGKVDWGHIDPRDKMRVKQTQTEQILLKTNNIDIVGFFLSAAQFDRTRPLFLLFH